MAIAYDAVAIPGVALYTATFSWTHTPAGTPKGVAVIVVQEGSTDQVSGVTYGGSVLSRVRSDVRTAAEPGRVYIYFLGASIPTGAQTVQVTLTGTADTNAVSLTVTSSADTAVDVSDGLDAGIILNPSLSISPTVAAVIFYGIFSGLAAPVTTVQTGSTHVIGKDYGVDSAMWARKSVAGGGATTIGYTAASDDVCHSALAIKEWTATPVVATPDTASLATTKYTPVITVTNNVLVTLGTLTQNTSLYIPVVTVSDNKTVTLGLASLTTTKYAPDIVKGTVVVPGLQTLILSPYVPGVVKGTIVTPGVAGLTTTTFVPTIEIVAAGTTVTLGTANLALTPFIPTISISAHITVTPNVANLIISLFAPTTNVGVTIIPNTLALALSRYVPVIITSNNVKVTLGTQTLVLSLLTPNAGVYGYKLEFVGTEDTLKFIDTEDTLRFADIEDALKFVEAW